MYQRLRSDGISYRMAVGMNTFAPSDMKCYAMITAMDTFVIAWMSMYRREKPGDICTIIF